MKKLIEHIKRQISCFKSEKSKAGASQNDKLSLGGRIAALEELLADISTDDRPLTPEILTAAGWAKIGKISNTGFRKNFEPIEIYISIGEELIIRVFDDYRVNPLHELTLNIITVGEFNTLLDIVKLDKFKIK